jgi:hypothetical protein
LHLHQDANPALWAQPEVAGGERRQKIAAIGRLRKQQGADRCQQLAAEIQLFSAVAVSQEAVVANALEAGRKRMLQEAAGNSSAETVITFGRLPSR